MDCGSDHNALIAEVCLKLKKTRRTSRPRDRWYLAKDMGYNMEASQAISNIVDQKTLSECNPNDLWREMRKALENATNKYNHNSDQRPKKQWISDATWGLIKARQQIKARGFKQNGDREEYSRLTKEINKALRKDKNTYVATICEEVERHAERNEPRDLFQKIKTNKIHSSTNKIGSYRLKTRKDTP